jgi:hypothetical protein
VTELGITSPLIAIRVAYPEAEFFIALSDRRSRIDYRREDQKVAGEFSLLG